MPRIIPPLHITFVEGIELGQSLQNVNISTSAKDIVENSVKEFAQYHQRILSFLNNYRPSYIDYTRGIRFWVHDALPNNLCHRYCAGVASLGSDNVSEFYHGLLNSNSESFPEINWEEIYERQTENDPFCIYPSVLLALEVNSLCGQRNFSKIPIYHQRPPSTTRKLSQNFPLSSPHPYLSRLGNRGNMRLVSYISFGLGLFSFACAAPLLADSSNAGVLFSMDHSASRFQARSSPQSSNRLPPLPPPPVTEEYSLPMVIPPPPADPATYDTLDPLLITFPGDNGTFVPDLEHRVQDWIVRILSQRQDYGKVNSRVANPHRIGHPARKIEFRGHFSG
ncbi:hypothetical protein EV359DRAFT_78866 [Lentinula novae-zelandiae]|nr:hypothetical protein EV359DRAFT_78866 [Lentinula novae-zelandiae]